MFYTTKAHRDGLGSYCKPCRLSKTKKWKKTPKGQKCLRRILSNKYGLVDIMYDKLLKEQNGRCAMCKLARYRGRDRYLHIDHNHDTGKVRGLLCYVCNTTLGKYEKWKKEIQKYLENAS